MEKLGIQPLLLIAQIVNFGIILFVLKKYLYQPILKLLVDRKQKIADSLKIVEAAQEAEKQLDKKKEEAKREAREEAKVIIMNARRQAEQLQAEMKEAARKDIKQVKEKLQKELETKYKRMEKELINKTVEIAASLAERILRNVLTDVDHHRLIQAQIKKLKPTRS